MESVDIEMENMITLQRGTNCWIAEYSGPVAVEVAAVLGTTHVPTPYRDTMAYETVQTEIQALNPDFIVL